MNQVFLRPNPTRQSARNAAYEVVKFLEENDFHVIMQNNVADVFKATMPRTVEFLNCEKAMAICDFVLAVGGDGTILHAAADAAKKNKPILGINAGTIGFLSEIEMSELDYLLKLQNGNFRLEPRMMLDVSVLDANENVMFNAIALNDVIITNGSIARVINIGIDVDCNDAIGFRGDGVVICTPTGSTAYSLSAGGPIMEPRASCMGITPICPHALNVKSFVISSEREITVAASSVYGGVYLSIDGICSYKIKETDRVLVKKSQIVTALLKIKEVGFYRLIDKKLSNER